MEFIENIRQKSAKIWSEFQVTLTVASINHTGNASHNYHETQTAPGSSTQAGISLIQASSSNCFNKLRKKKNHHIFSFLYLALVLDIQIIRTNYLHQCIVLKSFTL